MTRTANWILHHVFIRAVNGKLSLRRAAVECTGNSSRNFQARKGFEMNRALRTACALILAFGWSAATHGQAKDQPAPRAAGATAEQRTARAFDAARANPLDLHAFLVGMPKGGDLHVHLSGAVYAESWIRAGVEDKLCVNTSSLSFVRRQSGACESGDVPAERAYQDQHLYDALVDAFSMRGF